MKYPMYIMLLVLALLTFIMVALNQRKTPSVSLEQLQADIKSGALTPLK